MINKEKMELLNLRKRVVAQREEILKLQDICASAKLYIASLEAFTEELVFDREDYDECAARLQCLKALK